MSLVGLDSEEAASNYKHEGTSKDLPKEFRRDWSCCGGPRCFGVGAGLSISDVPYVAFGIGELVPFDTHSQVPRPHDQSVVAHFRCRHSSYEVNITSLPYTVDTSASSEANNRVIVSACDATATTYVAHAFFSASSV